MKKLAALALSLFLTTGPVFADSPKDTPKESDAQPAKSSTAAKPATPKTNAEIAAEVEELRQTLQAQQEQIQMMKEELAKRDREIEAAREAAASANSRATDANAKAVEAVNATAEVKATQVSLDSTVNSMKTSNAAVNSTVANMAGSQEKSSDEPVAIRYKGITITPGGFVAAETVWRQHAISADINTPFNNTPYSGTGLYQQAENNFTARQSRLSLLMEGKIDTVKLTGYYEADWLGTGVTSNNRESNSYVFRQRVLYAQAATDSGWIITGGQQWSLATENRKGILNRQEWTPATIDPQYTVGWDWERQYGFRVVKDFSGKFALGFAIEAPQATIGGRGFSSVTTTTVATATTTVTGNTFINAPGAGGGLYNFVDTAGYTVNKAPDLIFKAAADPAFGHFELLGILSFFGNRVYPCGVVGTNTTDTVHGTTTLACSLNGSTTPSVAGAYNANKTGGGIAASARFALLHNKVDIGIKALGGDGVLRYGTAQLADLTFRPDGTAALLRGGTALGRIEYHPNAKLDIYAYYGAEYAWRSAYVGYDLITITKTPAIPATTTSLAIPATTTTSIKTGQIGGYGSPYANNSGCSTEGLPSFTTLGGGTAANQLTPGSGTCAGDTRLIAELSAGFWHKLYQGPKGGLRWGIQYSYIYKDGWSGNNTAPTATTQPAGVSPRATNNMVFTSFRYYIP